MFNDFRNILIAIGSFLFGILIHQAVVHFTVRDFWKDKYHECQDNYQAISLENSELRDSLNQLTYKINAAPNTLQVHD